MKVFLLGACGSSKTAGKVIITVELLPNHTDMKAITVYHGKHIVNPFYRKLHLNAGKVTCISDLEEEHEHNEATVLNGYTLKSGKYFYLYKGDTELDQSEYLPAYQYKIAVLEQSGYIARGYTGAQYTHYETGNIQTKIYYHNGTLHSRFYYRDDNFNTLDNVRQYRNGVLDCEFNYDIREALIRQRWYDSKGKIYYKINVTNEETIAEPPTTEHITTVAEPEPEPEPEMKLPGPGSDSESDSESDSDSGPSSSESATNLETESKSDGNGSNLGTNVGGMRFKRDGDND